MRVFDSVSVGRGERTVAIGSLQQKALLTLLVANKGRSVSLDAIADEIWPDVRPRRWRGCIATLANSLRTAAGDRDFVASTARGYTLHRHDAAVCTDVDELHRCLDEARQAEARGEGQPAEERAQHALAIYGTGPWTTDYWGWNEAAAEAARILATALLRRGAHVACITVLSRMIEDFDWDDGLWACLICAHHRLGSTRRALELTAKAKLAVGAGSPALAGIEAQLSAPSSLDERVLVACSA
ncbi:MAG: hypothetical protein M3326_09210 [Actinomycetota bacterium]|nr:hypothetical protein [Actinomycetota bacterium]